MRLLEGEPPPEIVGSILPLAAKRPAEPSILDEMRSWLARTTSRQVLGWVLVVG